MEKSRDSRLYVLVSLLVLTLITAYAIRSHLGGLGDHSFWDDEFSHVFAAKGLLASGKPTLPSGWLYTRSLPYTYLVAASFAKLGVSEFSARLPSVIAYLLLIQTVFLVARRFFGWLAATLAVVYLSVDPLLFVFSRISRMYSLFVLLFFIGSYAAFRVSEELFSSENHRMPQWRLSRLIVWSVMALVAFLVSGVVHSLAALFAPALAIYLMLDAFLRRPAGNHASRRAEMVTGAILLALVVGGYLLIADKILEILPPPTVRPAFAYYWEHLATFEPLLLPGALLGTYYSWRQRSRGGLFMVVTVAVGLFAQIVIFADRSNIRYALQYLPFLGILAALGIVSAAESLSAAASKVGAWGKQVTVARLIAVAACVVFVIGRSTIIDKIPSLGYSATPDYTKAFQKIENSGYYESTDVIASTIPMATIYYGGRTEYWVREYNYQHYLLKDYLPGQGDKLTELYSGAALVRNRGEIVTMMAASGSGWLVADSRYRSLSEETRSYIEKKMTLYYQEPDILWVFRWDGRQ